MQNMNTDKRKGLLIVIEGADGAGKATHTELLIEALIRDGHKVMKQDFPRYYTSVFGKLIGEALRGDHGDFLKMSPYLSSLPYALDRMSASKEMKEALEEGTIIISNRFTPSNIAFQAAKLPKGKKRTDFIKFLEHIEYTEGGVPKPDLVVYLNVPTEIAQKLIIEKGVQKYMNKKGTHDQYEKDKEYQREVARVYMDLAKSRKDWVSVELSKKGKMLSKEENHKKVLGVVKKYLR